MSRASISAKLFSKPCCARFENGNASGSAQTFSSVAYPKPAHRNRTATAKLRKRKHIERASLRGVLRQFLAGVRKSKRSGGVARVQSARDDRPRPPANARQNRQVLLPVWSFVCHRLADDPRPRLELPQLLAGH